MRFTPSFFMMIMKNTYPLIAFVVLVVGGLSFYGGMVYQKSRVPSFANLTPEQRAQQFAGRGGAGGIGGRGGQGRQGAFVNGEVIAKDDKTVTLKLRDGGSRIVFFSASTTIGKMTEGSLQDVTTGSQIMVGGTTNSDGSLTAQSIQLRPNMPMPPFGSASGTVTSTR